MIPDVDAALEVLLPLPLFLLLCCFMGSELLLIWRVLDIGCVGK